MRCALGESSVWGERSGWAESALGHTMRRASIEPPAKAPGLRGRAEPNGARDFARCALSSLDVWWVTRRIRVGEAPWAHAFGASFAMSPGDSATERVLCKAVSEHRCAARPAQPPRPEPGYVGCSDLSVIRLRSACQPDPAPHSSANVGRTVWVRVRRSATICFRVCLQP